MADPNFTQKLADIEGENYRTRVAGSESMYHCLTDGKFPGDANYPFSTSFRDAVAQANCEKFLRQMEARK
jgi:hypothetical protein